MTTPKRPGVALAAILAILGMPVLIDAQASPAVLADRPMKSAPEPRLDALMRLVADAAAGPVPAAGTLAKSVRRRSGGRLRFSPAGEVQAYVRLQPGFAGYAALLAQEGLRVDRVNERLGLAQVWIAPVDLRRIAQLPFVRRVDAPGYPRRRAGSVQSEGDTVVRADDVRNLGFTGAGVKVGVISDGVIGMTDSQVSGDLPGEITVLRAGCESFQPLCSTQTFSCSEGTAMLEIVHDLAPAAQLGFCGPDTSLDMVDCIERLRSEFGADVIVDDLLFLDEPLFEDGDIGGAVAEAVDAGVIYASAAGNDQDGNYYEADYVPSFISDDTYDSEQDFGAAAGGSSDIGNRFLIPPDGAALVSLQWNDRFGQSGNDYDLYLVDADTDAPLTSSTEFQEGDGEPLETLCYENQTGNSIEAQIEIARVAGAANRHLKLFNSCVGGACRMDFARADGAIFGHPAVLGALAVGAVGPPTGTQIEDYSSRGPVRIDFPALQSRAKPDLVAPDCVSVTGHGGFPETFCGTSAAAPHVAAVAALLRSATGADVTVAMLDAALDLGAGGFDNTYGAGRVDAYQALQELGAPAGGGDDGGGSLVLGLDLGLLGLCALRRRLRRRDGFPRARLLSSARATHRSPR